jgi:hypothetical protein
MHQVESLTRLYRARYYWCTPDLADRYQDLADRYQDVFDRLDEVGLFPSEFFGEFIYGFVESLERQIDPNCQSSRIFYEPCPVVKTTAMEVIVVSQNIPLDILELFPDFYKGGKFHINKAKLQRDGKALHTRYGEYFYIAVPDSAIALPESKELLEVAL